MKKQSFTRQYANPLKRGGLSRPERPNADLRPETARVDGRSLQDLLHFWYDYARQINYFGSDPEVDEGDWLPFFRRSIPFQYAQIAAHDLEAIEQRFTELRASIDSRLTFASLNGLFDLLFEMADRLAQWKENLRADEAGLRAALEGLVETNLQTWTIRLIGLTNAAGKWGYQPTLNLESIKRELGIGLPQSFAVDRSILRLRGSLKHKVLDARDILEEIYRVLWKATEAVVETAKTEEILERSLRSEVAGDHPAHLGLMFAFLLLFKELQGSLNELSTSHLEFFYRQTLRLDELPARNDRAHLVFSLGKQVREAIRVEKGTRFKAGKDAAGADVFFELPADHIVTQTQVGDLRTLFIAQGKTGSVMPNRICGVHAAPVANSADGEGGPFPKGEPQTWPTVGADCHRAIDPDTGEPSDTVPYPEARLGWLVAGKVLLLREGKRIIDITITLDDTSLTDYDYPAAGAPLFKLYLSTDEGWLPAPEQPLWTRTGNILSACLTLNPDFPPVVFPAEAEKFGMDRYGTTAPLLKAELDHAVTSSKKCEALAKKGAEAPRGASWYYALRTQTFSNVSIAVKVCDLRQIVVQNDLAVLDPNKPFMPFGPIPKAKSSNFYIGSEELYCKKWEQVDFTLHWKDNPDGLKDHYQGYPSPPEKVDFKGELTWLFGKDFISNGLVSRPLFGNTPASLKDGKKETDVWICKNPIVDGMKIVRWKLTSEEIFTADSEHQPTEQGLNLEQGYRQNLPSGFFRVQLGAHDFLHHEYATVLISAALKMPYIENFETKFDVLKSAVTSTKEGLNTISTASEYADDTNFRVVSKLLINDTKGSSKTAKTKMDDIGDIVDAEVVNAPYTPLLESIRLDYRATDQYDSGGLQLWHLHPWEGTFEEIKSDPETEQLRPNTLLPCFLDEGSLYLGLDNYQPGELLNLYFQLDPATADPTVDTAIVCWEYLRGNNWYPLRPDAEVLSDTTQGLIRPGIVTLSVPTKISNEETTILPADRHWIKARVALRTAAICETIRVATQAAEVVYAPAAANDNSRLAAPLPTGGIAKLAAPVNGIKGVEQPAASFGGRAPEAARDYYDRVSEQLRHKDRAISIYDYEHLVLAEFPQIYRVKCLNHTLGRRGEPRDYELSPGFVTLVVVPDLTRLSDPDVYQPKVPAADLQAIKDFLAVRTTPFLRLEVLNPIYQPVGVQATVRFHAGKSPTFYQAQLEQDLRTFLAPWSGENPGADISFGGALYYSSVVRFIEERPYVAHVLELGLLDGEKEDSDTLQERIEARTARTVLTTAKMHTLDLDNSDFATATTTQTGIGYDFKILT